MIEAAIIGLGRWGQRLVTSVQGKSDRMHFKCGFVRNPEPVREFAQQQGLHLAADFESILQDPTLDAVVLATPNSLHVKQITAIAQAGKAVFCEKPLALTAADAGAAISACEQAGVALGVGHDKRFWPSMQYLTEVVKQGGLGNLLHMEGHFSNEMARLFPAVWRASSIEAPAGPMTATGIHILDALIRVAGPMRNATAQLNASPEGTAPYNALSGLLQFENGLGAVLSTVHATPLYWRVHVFGTHGSVEALGPTRVRLLSRSAAPQEFSFEPVDSQQLGLEAFADAVAGHAPYPITTTEIIAVSAGLDAIARSVELGEKAYCR